MSSYDSFNNPKHGPRLGPNAHDDLKSSVPKEQVDPPRASGGPPRWEPPPGVRHEHPRHSEQEYNRNSQEMDNDSRADMYR